MTEHGIPRTYVYGCRCYPCRLAMSEYKRAWRARGGRAVERDRVASRLWKARYLGQPGKAADLKAIERGTEAA
jgi:hypothetical protein